MSMTGQLLFFLTTFFFTGSSVLHCQESPEIGIRFLKGKFLDTNGYKDVVTAFMITVKDTADFPPVIQIPPRCTVFEDNREKVVLLNPHTLSVGLYDKNIYLKNPEIYALIKDVIDTSAMSTSMIIIYKITDLNYHFKRMSLTPAFEEKRNKSSRVEKRCEFDLSH